MAFPAYSAGETLTADKLNARLPVIIVKTADQSRTSSTALVDDNHLRLPVGANQQWFMRLVAGVEGHVNGDVKAIWSIPSGASGRSFVLGPEIGMPSSGRLDTSVRINTLNFTTENRYGTETGGTAIVVRQEGILTTGSSSGIAQFRWGQNTSSSTPTIVRSGSFIWAQRIA